MKSKLDTQNYILEMHEALIFKHGKKRESATYHESKPSNSGPRGGKGCTSKLKLAKISSKHDRNQTDSVVESISKNHR